MSDRAMKATEAAVSMLIPDVINLYLKSKSAEQVIAELHGALATNNAVIDPSRLLDELLVRHAMGSSCLDQEVALPHVRTLAVKRLVFAVGRSQSGVAFDAEHPSIRLILVIGVPPAATAEYLRWVAQLARTLRSSSARSALMSASDADAFNAAWALCQSTTKA